MTFWQRVFKWQKQIEKMPKSQLGKVLIIVFTASIFLGATLSYSLNQFEARAIESTYKDIQKLETTRMDKRVEHLKVRYETVNTK